MHIEYARDLFNYAQLFTVIPPQQYYRRNNYHNHNNNYNHSKNHDGNNIPNMNQNNLQSNPSWNNNPNNNANATPTTAASTTQSDSNDQSSTTSSNINNSANRKGKVQQQHQQQAYRDNNGNYHFNNHAGYHKNHYQQHLHNQPNNYNSINGGGAGTQLTEHTGYLRLRGLPYASTVQDIQYFFANYELVESTIAFTFKSDGRATGEAYVEFSSPEDSHKAMLGMHRKIMGSRYIEIFISFKEEHARALVRFQNR